MLVRAATALDARAIATIHVDAWRAAYAGIVPEAHLQALSIDDRESRWQKLLAAREFETMVAERAGAVIGWATHGKSRDPDAAPGVGELMAIYVAPAAWGSGAGRELWLHARQALLAARFGEATVWVLRDNARAIRFYELAGFVIEPDSDKTVTIGGSPLIEVRLRASINRA